MQNVAQRAERVRDLRAQVSEITAEEAKDILFIESSPGRQPVTLYSLLTGEPVRVPRYMVESVMNKRLSDGRFAFTGDPDRAPVYKKGAVKCFLHPDAPERAIIEDLGIESVCGSAMLRSQNSKRIHAQHRHKQEWAAYQEHIADQKSAEEIARQQQQLEATMALAKAATRRSA